MHLFETLFSSMRYFKLSPVIWKAENAAVSSASCFISFKYHHHVDNADFDLCSACLRFESIYWRLHVISFYAISSAAILTVHTFNRSHFQPLTFPTVHTVNRSHVQPLAFPTACKWNRRKIDLLK